MAGCFSVSRLALQLFFFFFFGVKPTFFCLFVCLFVICVIGFVLCFLWVGLGRHLLGWAWLVFVIAVLIYLFILKF